MCGKSAHIAPFAEMAVFRGVAAHYAPFGEGTGKGRRGFALRWSFALDFQLCDSFPALDLAFRQTASDEWRRKTGGSVELAGSFSNGFKR
jgi:hypothetical protein